MIILSPFTRGNREPSVNLSNVSQGPVILSKNTAIQMEVINPKFRAIIELSNDDDRMITKKQRIEWLDALTDNAMSDVDIKSYLVGGDEI